MAAADSRAAAALALWLGLVLAGCALCFMGVAALAPQVLNDIGLEPARIGWFSGVVWAAALLASLWSAPLVARWGAWAVARGCLLAASAGVLAVAQGQLAGFWVGAVLIGIAQGLEAPAASQLLGHHVARPRQPVLFSLKQCGVQVGAVTASLSLPVLALHLGWQAALVVVAAVLLALAALLGRPARRHPLPADGAFRCDGVMQALRSGAQVLVQEPRLGRLALAAATFGAMQVCMNSFLVTWLVDMRGLPLGQAGMLAATAQGAGLLGRPLWGWVASCSGRACALLACLGAAMAVCSALIGGLGSRLPTALLVPLAAAFGLTASGWNGVFLAEVARLSRTGTTARNTAAVMVPMYLGLIGAPVVFAVVSTRLGLSAGFLMTAVLAFVGTACVASRPWPLTQQGQGER